MRQFAYDRTRLLEVIEKTRLGCRLLIITDLDLLMSVCAVQLRHKPEMATVSHIKQMYVCFTDYTRNLPLTKLLDELFPYIDNGLELYNADDVVDAIEEYFAFVDNPSKRELVFLYTTLLMLCRNRPWWLRTFLKMRPGKMPHESLLDYTEERIKSIKSLHRETKWCSKLTKYLALHTYAAEIERLVITALGVSVTEIPSVRV